MIEFEEYKNWSSKFAFWPSSNSRFIDYSDLKKKVESYKNYFEVISIGKSEKGKSIFKVCLGSGEKKIMSWSQMHGNETSGTLAAFDFLDYLIQIPDLKAGVESKFCIQFILMVNPDGAEVFERRNSQGIDLNRDAIAQQAPETKLLIKEIKDFQPHITFNLHDQRTLFSVGKASNPATISFLIPSFDFEKTVNKIRSFGMGLVASVWKSLPLQFQNNVGRYNDAFYPTAFGDNIQKTGVNCVLIEAGAALNDPKRSEARLLVGFSLFSFLKSLTEGFKFSKSDYLEIPENEQKLKDIIVSSIKLKHKRKPVLVDVSFKLEEWVEKGKFCRSLIIEDIGDLTQFKAYQPVNGNGLEFEISEIYIGRKMNFQEFQHIFWEGVII